jgi:hypothetical protein
MGPQGRPGSTNVIQGNFGVGKLGSTDVSAEASATSDTEPAQSGAEDRVVPLEETIAEFDRILVLLQEAASRLTDPRIPPETAKELFNQLIALQEVAHGVEKQLQVPIEEDQALLVVYKDVNTLGMQVVDFVAEVDKHAPAVVVDIGPATIQQPQMAMQPRSNGRMWLGIGLGVAGIAGLVWLVTSQGKGRRAA